MPKEEILEEQIEYEEIPRPGVEPVPPASMPLTQPPVMTFYERPKVVSSFSEKLNIKISNVKSLRKIEPSEIPSPTVIIRCRKCNASFTSEKQ